MTLNYQIQRTETLPPDLGSELIPAARQESFGALERLRADWLAGANRFSAPGEGLYIARVQGRLIGVCGLNRDPYSADAGIGRLRRLYVHPGFRRNGVGRALVERVMVDSRACFHTYQLRTVDPQASAFYQALGFIRVLGEPAVTHRLVLNPAIQ